MHALFEKYCKVTFVSLLQQMLCKKKRSSMQNALKYDYCLIKTHYCIVYTYEFLKKKKSYIE